MQARLAHEVAQDRRRAQPAQACGGKGHAPYRVRSPDRPSGCDDLLGLDRGLGLGQPALLGLDVGLRAEVQHRVVGALDARRDLRRVEHRAIDEVLVLVDAVEDEAPGRRPSAASSGQCLVMSSVGSPGSAMCRTRSHARRLARDALLDLADEVLRRPEAVLLGREPRGLARRRPSGSETAAACPRRRRGSTRAGRGSVTRAKLCVVGALRIASRPRQALADASRCRRPRRSGLILPFLVFFCAPARPPKSSGLRAGKSVMFSARPLRRVARGQREANGHAEDGVAVAWRTGCRRRWRAAR